MSGDYKEKIEAFRSSCRFYRQNKRMYDATPENEENRQHLHYIHDDIMFVERMFERIREKCGTGARLILYLLFVEERTQEDVAEEYNMTRRQLQYSVRKWLKSVFESD
jgi:DNA-directed RNA polymerase specialized sigma subunit